MNKPRYIDWFVEEKELVVQGGHEVRSYRIDYTDDSAVNPFNWALSFKSSSLI